ncbi:hypothetical protein [Longimicrobium sp.]|uniref:hypothetical protein n=1 Tax=Longimicrobium sp. TaxID=2029185 RepID=UPI002BF6395F|nr:hypothetical protein [Longimicrobium sp.]HSU15592.1 hypothetical protein [Longimicrobium sp.]
MTSIGSPRRSFGPWLVLALGLLGSAYACAGYAMAGSFIISNPSGHFRPAATVYLCLMAAGTILSGFAAAGLWRRRRVETPR